MAGADDAWPAEAELAPEELEELPQALSTSDAVTAIAGMSNFFEEHIVRLLVLAI